MAKAFKVINIILVVLYGIIAVVTITGISSAGAAAAEKRGADAALGGANILIALLTLIPVLLAIYMAVQGLKSNYETCYKLAAVLMVLNIITFIASDNKRSAVFSLVFSIVYCFMAKMLDSKY